MNAKTCKRMRRYIKSLGYDPKAMTVYLQKGTTAVRTLPYTVFGRGVPALSLHPESFRGQYQKLKKMVKQHKLSLPFKPKKLAWTRANALKDTGVFDDGAYLVQGKTPDESVTISINAVNDNV